MSRASSWPGVIVAILLILAASRAHAVSCTINGTVSIEPQDSFYCDTSILGSSACNNWREVDLDTGSKPMQYMWIAVVPHNGTQNGTIRTDANGNWTATVWVNAAQCLGQEVDIEYRFARLSEFTGGFQTGLPLGQPVYRFRIVDVDEGNPGLEDDVPGNALHVKEVNEDLDGPTTTVSQTWGRGSTAKTTRYANAYYTANSMLKEITTWSSNLNDRFSSTNPNNILRIALEDTWDTGGAWAGGHQVMLSWNAYGAGGVLRHEIGHIVHGYVHHGDRNANCGGYGFNESSCTAGKCLSTRSCDYGSTAFGEALATLFGVRSLTSNDTHVWSCGCFDGAIGGQNYDICSQHAAATFDGDNDWFFDCVGGQPQTFWHMGDDHSSSPANCVRLNKEGGCNCTGASDICPTAFVSTTGWRNGAQITRFLWDMLDASTDGGQDNDDFGITDIIAVLEAMPCSGSHEGEDGSCEEQASTPCDPPDGPDELVADGGPPPNGPSPNRDSYNVYDLGEALPNSQGNERVLNCVQGALD
jgi:hypothetical protein